MYKIFVLVSLCLNAGVYAATASSPQPRATIPESAYVSPHLYTNAFFGFSVSLPSSCRFEIFDQSEPDYPLNHFLFGEKCSEKGFTTFLISAKPLLGSPDDEAQKAVMLLGAGPRNAPEAFSVSGRLFWKQEAADKISGRKLWRARYATVARGFVVSFWISSYSSRIISDLQQAVESMKFFDPAHAEQMAGPGSHPYLPDTARMRIQSSPEVDLAQLDAGAVHGNVYINTFLGFSYAFPEGWIPSAKSSLQTVGGNSGADPNPSSSMNSAPPSDRCLRVLSSFTRYAEHSRVLEFNPRLTLLAANPSCFIPDMKFPTSLQDKNAVESYGRALVQSFAGTRLMGRQKIKLYGVTLAGHIFLEVGSTNAEPITGSPLLRKVHTELILTTMHNAWVIWLFESDSDSDLGQLLKTSLSFVSDENRTNTP